MTAISVNGAGNGPTQKHIAQCVYADKWRGFYNEGAGGPGAGAAVMAAARGLFVADVIAR